MLLTFCYCYAVNFFALKQQIAFSIALSLSHSLYRSFLSLSLTPFSLTLTLSLSFLSQTSFNNKFYRRPFIISFINKICYQHFSIQIKLPPSSSRRLGSWREVNKTFLWKESCLMSKEIEPKVFSTTS